MTLIKSLSAKYGIKRFNFQHDNFTVNKKKVFAVLNAIDEEGLDITWTCSSSLNTLDEELINRMASTGCEEIFIGFESGSPRMQKIIGKRLKLERSVEVIRHITKANISFTASFMMGFPEETMEDLLQTIALMTELKFEGNGDEILQLHMLAPNPGTPLNEELGDNLLFDNYFSDRALSEFTGDDLEMIRKHPDVFTVFYHYPTPHIDRKMLLRINYLISNMRFFPYTLFILWKDKDFDYPNLFIREISSLKIPDTIWDHVFHNDNVTNTARFLTHVLNKLGFREHYILDVIKYEAAANKTTQYNMQHTKSTVEEFNYDVEGALMDINQNKFSKLPDIIKNDKHKLLFMKNNAKVSTVRLHSKLSNLYWIMQTDVTNGEFGQSQGVAST